MPRRGARKETECRSPEALHLRECPAMVDVFSPAVRSRVMAAVRSRGNHSTELALASALRKTRLTGWRRHTRLSVKARSGTRVSVRPDFVFAASRVAVFVDGCFWHGCPIHCKKPKTHASFWRKKISGNRRRDLLVSRTLRKAGWRVLRLWEHQIEMDPELAVVKIVMAIKQASR